VIHYNSGESLAFSDPTMIGKTIGHYDVLSELGSGGMGRVYLAQDQKLKRRVALKVLHPETASDGARMKRFQQEAEIVASMNHPGIVTLYSIEEAEGLSFLTMELVEGKPLDRRISEGGLPLDELLELAVPLLEAVAAAHERGITHRDLKPPNILVSDDGRVKVLDFGLAKLREPRFDAGESTSMLTQEGSVLGTAAYMSPEQAEGMAVDARSDVFALGVVLYEMATGERPFQGATNISILSAVLKDRQQPVDERRRDLPARLGRIVDRCLEKDPAARYASAADLLADVRGLQAESPSLSPPTAARRPAGTARWIGAGLVLLLVAALAVWAVARRGGVPADDAGTPAAAESAPLATRVLVLPFENRTGDESLAGLGLMASDWLTQGLARTGRLEVAPLLPDLGSEGPADPAWLRRVAEGTGAGTVVSGAYYLQGDELQISARIYDTRQGDLLAALDPVSAPRGQATEALERLRQRVTGAIATFIDPELGSVANLVSRPPSFEAYESFLNGMERYTAMDFRGAIPQLRRAAEEDADYITPLLMVASAHYNLFEYAQADAVLGEIRPRQETLAPLDRYNLDYLSAELAGDRGMATRAAQRAAELSPGSHWTFRYGVAALMSNDPAEAVEAMESLDPAKGFVRGWVSYTYHLASAYHYLGDHAKELAEIHRAREVSPESLGALGLEIRARAAMGELEAVRSLADESVGFRPEWLDTPGSMMLLAGHELAAHGHPEAAAGMYEEAVAWHQRLPGAEAAVPRRHQELGEALLHVGRLEEARSVFAELAAAEPDRLAYQGLLGMVSARLGEDAEVARIDTWLEALERPYLVGENFYWRAVLAAWRGEADDATALLREAYARGRPYHRNADEHPHIDPNLAPLRGTPGFEALATPRGRAAP
jgi:tRNA A-37 threonylcarbamoyl transferase component Bud32/tetratricopeptide (TPR) repeat protein